MSRTKKFLTLFCLAILVCSCLVLIGCSQEKPAEVAAPVDQEAAKFGGTLVVAKPASPPHLDPDKATGPEISDIMYHVYEGLFEMNDKYEPIPQLAEGYTVADEGKTYVITLRQGVKFHNGKEMTSDDVVPSINRWLNVNGGGAKVKPFIASVTADSPYQVTVKFTEVYAPFLNMTASYASNQKLVIRPKELIEKFGEEVITEPIGTGPYKFVEWIPDQHVKLAKFAEYVPVTSPASGEAGARIAYVDEIKFQFVTEPAVRVAGVQTGEYHFADQVPTDQYDEFAANPDLQAIIVNNDKNMLLTFNMGQAPFNNIKARQAVSMAMDLEELGRGMVGNEKFWTLEPSLFAKGSIWYDADAGQGVYNVVDLEKAKALLKESGYDGKPVVILQGREDPNESPGAMVLKSQLEKIGMVVDVQLYDRATVVDLRAKVDTWNIHLSPFRAVYADPQVYGAWMGTKGWITNWDDADSKKMDDIFARMIKEIDYTKRLAIVKEWNKEVYTTLPYIKTVNFSRLHLANKSLQGYVDFPQSCFWNVWLEK